MALPMRILLALLAASFLVVPAASAAPVPVDVVVDPDVAVSPDGCDLCVDVGLEAGVGMTNCFDCPAHYTQNSVHAGPGGASASTRVCYGAYVHFCLVDETVRV